MVRTVLQEEMEDQVVVMRTSKEVRGKALRDKETIVALAQGMSVQAVVVKPEPGQTEVLREKMVVMGEPVAQVLLPAQA